MKRTHVQSIMTLAIICLMGGTQLFGQGLGAGIALLDGDFGIQARYERAINETINGAANFTLFFPDGGSGWAINADGHYLFSSGDGDLLLYPFAGVNFAYGSSDDQVVNGVTVEGSSDTEIGINLGGGINIGLTDNLRFFGEVKYVIVSYDELVINAGVLFPFGGS